MKKDRNLRHAIDLYHLTDYFFPTSALPLSDSNGGAGAKSSDSAQSIALDEEIDFHIRKSILGKTTTQSPENSVDAAVEMRGSHTTLTKRFNNDEEQFGSAYASSNAGNQTAESLFPLSKQQSSRTTSDVHAPLPPVDDQEAVQRYIAEMARKTAAKGIREMGDPDLESLDSRGSQVRDALFGTVRGSLPGLEVLRERVKEREGSKRADEGADRTEGAH